MNSILINLFSGFITRPISENQIMRNFVNDHNLFTKFLKSRGQSPTLIWAQWDRFVLKTQNLNAYSKRIWPYCGRDLCSNKCNAQTPKKLQRNRYILFIDIWILSRQRLVLIFENKKPENYVDIILYMIYNPKLRLSVRRRDQDLTKWVNFASKHQIYHTKNQLSRELGLFLLGHIQ